MEDIHADCRKACQEAELDIDRLARSLRELAHYGVNCECHKRVRAIAAAALDREGEG